MYFVMYPIRPANCPQVNCKICLKSAGLQGFWLVLCYLNTLYHRKQCINFNGLSGQENIG